MCQKLGIEPDAVYELARWLWDHGMNQEREFRIAEGGGPMIKTTDYRGHITEQLIRSFERRTSTEEGSRER